MISTEGENDDFGDFKNMGKYGNIFSTTGPCYRKYAGEIGNYGENMRNFLIGVSFSQRELVARFAEVGDAFEPPGCFVLGGDGVD